MTGYTTYQLLLLAGAATKNVYTIYGDDTRTMVLPAAWQLARPLGANIGGVAPSIIRISTDAAFDSWLTVGEVDGNLLGAVASVGIEYDTW